MDHSVECPKPQHLVDHPEQSPLPIILLNSMRGRMGRPGTAEPGAHRSFGTALRCLSARDGCDHPPGVHYPPHRLPAPRPHAGEAGHRPAERQRADALRQRPCAKLGGVAPSIQRSLRFARKARTVMTASVTAVNGRTNFSITALKAGSARCCEASRMR
jgi:hypothetical protein